MATQETAKAAWDWCTYEASIIVNPSSGGFQVTNSDFIILPIAKLRSTIEWTCPGLSSTSFTQYYSNYNLRNSEEKLALPKPRTNHLKRSFSYGGAILWNKLPNSSKNVGSVDQFK